MQKLNNTLKLNFFFLKSNHFFYYIFRDYWEKNDRTYSKKCVYKNQCVCFSVINWLIKIKMIIIMKN